MTDPTLYDRIPYTSRAMPQTHPARLATVGRLFGMEPAAIDGAGVLELGCGDGGNLIPMALGLPRARLAGIDFSAAAIGRGRALVEALGISTVELIHRDLRDGLSDLGTFDYIVCHGVFSWVPSDVREAVLRLIRECLRPRGIAFVSYNALPGGYLRSVVNDLMRFHTRRLEDPEERMRQAMAILEFAAEGAPDGAGAYREIVREERERLKRSDSHASLVNHLIHDRFQEGARDFYFHEFMEHCDGHRLAYLGEADFFEMQDHFLPERIREILARVSGGNLRVREQMLDFLKGRKFRQTLLCHADVRLNRRLDPRDVMDCFVASAARPLDADGQTPTGDEDEWMRREDLVFGRVGGTTLASDHPVVRRAFFHLARTWPMPVSFAELMAAVSERISGVDDEDRLAVAESLLSGFCGNLVEICAEVPRFARTPGERPAASPVAIRQLESGTRVTTLTHRFAELEGTYAPWLLPLMDGTRDRATVIAEGRKAVRAANATLNGHSAAAKTDVELDAEVAAELMNCARYALLVEESDA